MYIYIYIYQGLSTLALAHKDAQAPNPHQEELGTGIRHWQRMLAKFGWHYLPNATCPIRPLLFSTALLV